MYEFGPSDLTLWILQPLYSFAGHHHSYQRQASCFNGSVVQHSTGDAHVFVKPTAAVHMMIGTAGEAFLEMLIFVCGDACRLQVITNARYLSPTPSSLPRRWVQHQYPDPPAAFQRAGHVQARLWSRDRPQRERAGVQLHRRLKRHGGRHDVDHEMSVVWARGLRYIN